MVCVPGAAAIRESIDCAQVSVTNGRSFFSRGRYGSRKGMIEEGRGTRDMSAIAFLCKRDGYERGVLVFVLFAVLFPVEKCVFGRKLPLVFAHTRRYSTDNDK